MSYIMEKLGVTVCHSPDELAAGSSVEATTDGDGASVQGDASSPEQAESAGTENKGILASDATKTEDQQKVSEGDKPDEKASSSDEGKKTGQEVQPIEFELSEGHEEFKDEFSAFADDMNAWLKDNPSADSKQLLQEAANRQAATILQQREDFIKQHNAQIETWENELKADKDLGGADFDKNMEIAKLARDKLGDEGLKDLLGKTGLGSHPSIVKIFHLAGKQLQSSPVLSGNGVSGDMTLGDALYGGKDKT